MRRQHSGAKMRSVLHEAVKPNGASSPGCDALAANLTSPSQAAVGDENANILAEALATLSVIDRHILLLRHFEELTNDEAARSLGVKKAAASRRYMRALSHLRQALGKLKESTG